MKRIPQTISCFRGFVSRNDRETANGHKAKVFWFTGLSGAGKSTIAHAVEKLLHDQGYKVYVFDGDNVRRGLCSNLSFSKEDRSENLRRICEMTKLFTDSGTICLCAFIAPLAEDRILLRQKLGDDYKEIFVSCPVEICEQRDVKGYYAKARAGKIPDYTGVTAPYDIPQDPDITIDTENETLEESVNNVHKYVLTEISSTQKKVLPTS